MESTRPCPVKPPAPAEPSTAERIREVALTCFATYGIDATPTRVIAEAAGVSMGLLQHRFGIKGTKAAIIAAVDEYVLQVLSEGLDAAPLPGPPSQALEEAGRRLTRMIAEHPHVFDYLGRALVEAGSSSGIGQVIFDGLTKISAAQGEHFSQQGGARDDLDYAWSVLLPIILRVGTIMLRTHIERYLRGPFYNDEQLRRWDKAVTDLLRHGLFDLEP
jgi:AcrR family transcriptional regulator